VLLALLTACIVVDAQTEREDFTETEDFSRVEIDVGQGDVAVSGCEQAEASGTLTTRFGKTPPTTAHYVDDGVLHVTATCEDMELACAIELALDVPRGVDVVVVGGSGDVTVEGVDGDVDVEAGSGDVRVADAGGRVTAETGSGDLVVTDPAGDVDASVGSGDIDVTGSNAFTVAASAGSGDVRVQQLCPFTRVDAETGSGDIVLAVPAGAYDLDARSDSGDVDVLGVSDDATAGSAIRAVSGSGDVVVGVIPQ
jgi:hypothetical protein